MKLFAVFYHTDLAGRLSSVMGSDGVCPLDGRFGRHRAMHEARLQALRLRAVKPDLLAVEIRRGNYRSSSSWGGIQPLTPETVEAVREAKAKGVVPF